jgi:D-3-phosphoglycerate dehydrogenase / 2-oxoglutarate reductase
MHTLVLEKMPKQFWEELEKRGISQWFTSDNLLFSENIEIIIIRTKTIFNESYFKRFPNLKLVIRAGTGVDNIDLESAKKYNVAITHTPNANALSAFEQAISFIFSLIKQQNQMKQAVLSKEWKTAIQPNLEMSDIKALVIGVGRVGTRVAQLLQQLGASVKGVDPYLTDDDWNTKQVESTTYVSGLKWCNLLTFHCPLTEDTKYYFSVPTLKLLSNPIYLINTARGAVVEENALTEGLNSGILTGIALDVFEEEPWEPSAFADLPHVLLSPHVGAYTEAAKRRLVEETVETWIEFVEKNLISAIIKY